MKNQLNWNASEDFPPEGCVWRERGTVFLHSGAEWVSIHLGPCSARCIPLQGLSRTVILQRDGLAKDITFTSRKELSMSRSLHRKEILRKMTEKEITDYEPRHPHRSSEQTTEEETNDNSMKIKMAVAVAFLVALGFEKAGEWDAKKVADRLRQVPDRIEADKVPDDQKELYTALAGLKEDQEITLEEVKASTKDKPTKDKAPAKSEKPAAKGKPAAKPAKGDDKEGSRGALGDILGFSVVSVLRRLGKEGVSVAHAREILKAQKVTASDTTVQIQISAGKKGHTAGSKGKPVTYAELTKEQVAKLIKSAKEPKE